MSANPIAATLKAVSAQVRALRKDWHPRADSNSDYQAGYSQAQHDALNIINDTARKEIRK